MSNRESHILGRGATPKQESELKKYVVKPDEIHAIKLSEENIAVVALWSGGQMDEEIDAFANNMRFPILHLPVVRGYVRQDPNKMIAHLGDYIVKNASGRYEVYSPDQFEAKYVQS